MQAWGKSISKTRAGIGSASLRSSRRPFATRVVCRLAEFAAIWRLVSRVAGGEWEFDRVRSPGRARGVGTLIDETVIDLAAAMSRAKLKFEGAAPPSHGDSGFLAAAAAMKKSRKKVQLREVPLSVVIRSTRACGRPVRTLEQHFLFAPRTDKARKASRGLLPLVRRGIAEGAR